MSAITDKDIAGAFQCIPIGVAVITTEQDQLPHGSTGMVWAETADPPLLLTTLRRTGTCRRLVADQQRFGANILSASQSELTWQFADQCRPSAERFAGVSINVGPVLGVPLLNAALASFECTLRAVYPFGQYDIVVGNVVWASAGSSARKRPVIHYGGQLWQLGGGA
jgi:flavin reductase (DIM6/NTAB) family NADH-FMN oxidoreductase RutF